MAFAKLASCGTAVNLGWTHAKPRRASPALSADKCLETQLPAQPKAEMQLVPENHHCPAHLSEPRNFNFNSSWPIQRRPECHKYLTKPRGLTQILSASRCHPATSSPQSRLTPRVSLRGPPSNPMPLNGLATLQTKSGELTL